MGGQGLPLLQEAYCIDKLADSFKIASGLYSQFNC
jgi:hypothetical protein